MPRPFPPRRDEYQPQRRKRQRATPSGDRASLPADLRSADRGVRLQKALADAGVAARRDCEDLILQGRVKVNGVVVAAMPAWVDPSTDRIEVDGQPLRRVKSVEVGHAKIYVLLNKPRGVITTTRDPEARATVSEMVQLPNDLKGRLFPVGRLDADSNGLILMTNDGELANRLTHPRYGVPKQYAVSVRGRLTQEDITTLKEGIHLAHLSHDADDSPTVKRASMANVELVGYGTDRNGNERTRLLVTLREGQNREIRRMIAHLGHKVRRLERVSIGPLTTKGLGVGQWRFLTTKEVNQLQRLGDKVAAMPARGQGAALSASSDEVRPPESRPPEARPPRARLSAARKPFQPRNPREPRKPRQTRKPTQGEGYQDNRPNTGDRPRRPRPMGDRPQFESGDRPRRPRPAGDRPNFEGGDRPRRPRPTGDRPNFEGGDRPRSPRPTGDRPRGPRNSGPRDTGPRKGPRQGPRGGGGKGGPRR